MSKRTQKTGISARYGSRYGVNLRRLAGHALRRSKAEYYCPKCQYKKVKREAAGIWNCRKCGHTFTGGVWEPFTRATEANIRLQQRDTSGASTSEIALLAQQAALANQKEAEVESAEFIQKLQKRAPQAAVPLDEEE